MADVRSLLRNERAQRRINHPQANYTATGTLECAVCHIPLKSDQEIWNKHLKSTQHAMRQERLRLKTSRPAEIAITQEACTGSKKRKADDEKDDSRKRTRPVTDISRKAIEDDVELENTDIKPAEGPLETVSKPESRATPINNSASTKLPSHPTQSTTAKPSPTIDEDEWAAFERDVATPPPDPSLPSALTAEATITAAPLTAAELAAQSREQASQQTKERREAEVEGEKEDAARALEEEFDEMEGLEERVARLRRMREELRAKREKVAEEKISEEAKEAAGGDRIDDEDDESDDEDDLYGWGPLGR